jgi:hypothetical protein
MNEEGGGGSLGDRIGHVDEDASFPGEEGAEDAEGGAEPAPGGDALLAEEAPDDVLGGAAVDHEVHPVLHPDRPRQGGEVFFGGEQGAHPPTVPLR